MELWISFTNHGHHMIASNGIHPIGAFILGMDWGALPMCVESIERLNMCLEALELQTTDYWYAERYSSFKFICLLWYLDNIILQDVTGHSKYKRVCCTEKEHYEAAWTRWCIHIIVCRDYQDFGRIYCPISKHWRIWFSTKAWSFAKMACVFSENSLPSSLCCPSWIWFFF